MEPLKILFLADAQTRDQYRDLLAGQNLVKEAMLPEGALCATKAYILEQARSHAAELLIATCGAVPMDTVFAISAVTAELPTLNVLLLGNSVVPQEVVMAAMRAGVREIVAPADAPALKRALERARIYRDRLQGLHVQAVTASLVQPQGEIWTVHAPKGGCGKSMLASNLAVALAQREGNDAVVLVDLDCQFGEQDLLFNLAAGRTLGDLASMEAIPDPEAVESALVRHSSGVKLLAAPRSPEEGELLSQERLEAILKALCSRYRWIVIDTDASLNEPTLRVMELASRIWVPFFPDLAHLRRLQGGLALWERLGLDAAKIACLAWTGPGEVGLSEAERVLKRAIAHAVPADAVQVRSAINAGEPLLLASPQSPCARGLVQAVRELLDPRAVPPDVDPGRITPVGRLSRFLQRLTGSRTSAPEARPRDRKPVIRGEHHVSA